MEYTKELEQFLTDNRSDMLSELTHIVRELKPVLIDLNNNVPPDSNNEEMIDVRLCIDRADTRHGYGDSNIGFTWIVRTGDASYDQRHSEYCGASLVGLDTDPAELLTDLINQIEE